MLHECMEHALINDVTDMSEYHGFTYTGESGTYKVTSAMVDEKLQIARDAFEDMCDEYEVEMYEAERTFKHPQVKDVGGTADFIALGKYKNAPIVLIGDWKFGDGIQVYADNNKQGLFYGWLAWMDKAVAEFFDGVRQVGIVIIQPNNRDEDDVRVWVPEEDTDKIMNNYAVDFMRGHKNNRTGEKNPCAGDWCQFCPATVTCTRKTGALEASRRIKPESMEYKQVTEALALSEELKKWIKYVEEFAYDQACLGVKFDGYKLVDKKAARKWIDEDVTLDKIRKAKKITLEEGTTAKIKSPAQLEKVFKKKKLDFNPYKEQYHSTSSGTTLVRDTDPRDEVLTADSFKKLRDMM